MQVHSCQDLVSSPLLSSVLPKRWGKDQGVVQSIECGGTPSTSASNQNPYSVDRTVWRGLISRPSGLEKSQSIQGNKKTPADSIRMEMMIIIISRMPVMEDAAHFAYSSLVRPSFDVAAPPITSSAYLDMPRSTAKDSVWQNKWIRNDTPLSLQMCTFTWKIRRCRPSDTTLFRQLVLRT